MRFQKGFNMFFGEYLVIKKAINEEQLLDALIYQVEHLPSFIRVLKDEKLFSSADMFRMIKIQLETNSDLIGVLRDENKINEEQLHSLFVKQANKRIMIGQVLVELKILEQSKVEKLLYDFIKDKEHLKSIQKEKDLASVEKVSAVVEVNDAALESLRELGILYEDVKSTSAVINKAEDYVATESNVFVDEFLNVFNSKMKNKFTKVVEMIHKESSADTAISNYFSSLYRDLHIIRGAAQVAELAFLESFLAEWEKVIESKLTEKDDKIREWCQSGVPALEKGLEHLWQMREIISKDKSEVNFKKHSDLVSKQTILMQDLKNLY